MLMFVHSFGNSGKFADFDVRCGPFLFKVHKVIVSAASKYFEALCGGHFVVSLSHFYFFSNKGILMLHKEAVTGSTSLDDEPVTVARMLQACYSGDYGTDEHETQLAGYMEDALILTEDGGSWGGCNPEFGTRGLVMHAKMYAFADKYDILNLRHLALTKFKARIKSDEVSYEDVLAAGQIIYETIPRNDDQLRKLVVYYTQIHMLDLHHLPLFKELMAKQDFGWDFGIKYASRAYLWCPGCVDWTTISAKCGCGFNALCEKSEICKAQDWSALQCEHCKKHGHLLREEPEHEVSMAMEGASQVAKNTKAPTTPPPTPKKRKH